MNNDSSIIGIIVFGGLALIASLRGFYTIYKREGPLMGRGKVYIVKGKYAVWAGAGEIIIGISLLVMAFNSYSFPTCSTFMVLLIFGTVIHFAGSFRDPDFTKEVQQQQELIKERDNDPIIIKKRKKSVLTYIVISLLLGLSIVTLAFYLGRDTMQGLSFVETLRVFFIGTGCITSLFVLAFLSDVMSKKISGKW